jgi:hypothetical protein
MSCTLNGLSPSALIAAGVANRVEGAVEDVDAAGPGIVGGVQQGLSQILADGQPGIIGARGGRLDKGCRAGVPGRDGTVIVGKDEVSGAAIAAAHFRDQE